uniref:Predicted protein n=1 Tax=Hordeum vulgare subsp. vulgare TaxID=112509 RepID=F2D2I5_HORVV|nr:predicted protein [Hordeum vulgare subsp. vulgare]
MVTRTTPPSNLAWMPLTSQPSGTLNSRRKRLQRLPATARSPRTTTSPWLRTSCTLMCSFLYPAIGTGCKSAHIITRLKNK